MQQPREVVCCCFGGRVEDERGTVEVHAGPRVRIEDGVDVVWGANEIEACDDLRWAGNDNTRGPLVVHTGLLGTAGAHQTFFR